jgi:hypothetical protein
MKFNEAEMRGIDLAELLKELPTSRESRVQAREHERFVKKFWDAERVLSVSMYQPKVEAIIRKKVSVAPVRVKTKRFSFSENQIEIAKRALEKNNGKN